MRVPGLGGTRWQESAGIGACERDVRPGARYCLPHCFVGRQRSASGSIYCLMHCCAGSGAISYTPPPLARLRFLTPPPFLQAVRFVHSHCFLNVLAGGSILLAALLCRPPAQRQRLNILLDALLRRLGGHFLQAVRFVHSLRFLNMLAYL